MKLTYTKREQNPRLILFFNGWGVPPEEIHIDIPGYDTVVVWQLSDFALPPLDGYEEVAVMAWSLGVHAAEIALQNSSLPISVTIAVNGTPTPVSDTRGIPTDIFYGTANALSVQSLTKFYRRMGAHHLSASSHAIERLRQELLNYPLDPLPFRWDHAVIATDDRIFPAENQRRAWLGKALVHETTASHTPDFQRIARSLIVDKSLVAERFAAHSDTYALEADVQRRAAGQLWEMWQKHLGETAKPGTIVEAGAGHGDFTRLYAPKLKPQNLILWDLNPAATPWGDVTATDAETAIAQLPEATADAIVSANALQWFNSPGEFIRQASRVLIPGGMLVLSTFGPQTFHELTQVGIAPLPYLSETELRRLLPASMEILELSSGLVKKLFDTPLDALHHIKLTGATGRPLIHGTVRSLISGYPRRPDGRVSLTYQPLFLIARK